MRRIQSWETTHIIMVSFEEHEKYKWLASGYKYEIQMFAVLWKHFEFLFEARLEGCLLK